MNDVATFFGWFCLAMVCLAGACTVIACMAYCCDKALQRYEWAIDEKVRHGIGRDIESSAHWFSESDDTYRAVRILGRRLSQGFAVDAGSWRNEWRIDKASDQTSEQP